MQDFEIQELARESARTRAIQIISKKPVIQGSLVESTRTCGKRGCKCYKEGPKHSATYLSIRQDNKRMMVFVPEKVLPYVKECITNHQNLQKALEIISRDCIDVFKTKKKKLLNSTNCYR